MVFIKPYEGSQNCCWFRELLRCVFFLSFRGPGKTRVFRRVISYKLKGIPPLISGWDEITPVKPIDFTWISLFKLI